jgi:hypothetical protein
VANTAESAGSSIKDTVTNVAIPAVTGAIGIAGGVLLGRTALQRNRKVLGVTVPGVKVKKVDVTNMTRTIGEAGRQFGKLAGEVKTAREKAEKISRAIS